MAEINGVFIDDLLAHQIPNFKKQVMRQDRDKILLFDGREGTGKSVLAMSVAKALDNNFNIDKIAWNHEQFINLIKDPSRKKGDFILLDEAFSSVGARNSLSSINKAMITIATEMRQLNLYIGIVLPSFFDLDRYFAIWRCETLFHTYFNKKGARGQYIIFPFNKKKTLYIKGKKMYNYNVVRSPYRPCRFFGTYVVDEMEYRRRKAEAFRRRENTEKIQKIETRLGLLVNHLIRYDKNYGYRKIGTIIGIDKKDVLSLAQKYKDAIAKPTPSNNYKSKAKPKQIENIPISIPMPIPIPIAR